ncbi:hypothetical protein [Methylomonas sp. YC3]
MSRSYKDHLIARHRFYINQANVRLLAQFDNMEEEAKDYGNKYLSRISHNFDPDRDNPDSFYENAFEESIEWYSMLDDMLSKTRLSVIAGMYHEWDKQLREWITIEINQWHRSDAIKNKIWSKKSCELFDLLEGLGWKIKSKDCYRSLERCRLVVNTFKHGDGLSFTEIKDKHKDLL